MELQQLIDAVYEHISNPRMGLPEEVFRFLTEVTPMVNVDLVIRDDIGRILLAWRDDEFCGSGWHIPGGIIRLKETLEERIQKTAIKEIGCEVIYEKEPAEVREIIHEEMKTRGHFITFVYECKVAKDYVIDQRGRQPGEEGYLQWHETFPDDMIAVHDFYKKYFEKN